MTEKRFSTNGYYIYDNFHDGEKWLVNEVEANEIVDVMNNLDTKARERSKALSTLQKKFNELHKENQRLNQTLENIQKELNKYNNEWVDLTEKRFSKCKDQCKVFDWVTSGVLDIREIVDTLNYYAETCLRYQKIISGLKEGTYKEPFPITQRK